jgi:hypothetical protein
MIFERMAYSNDGPLQKKMDPQELRQQMTCLSCLCFWLRTSQHSIDVEPPRSLSNMFKLLPSTPLLDCVLQTSKYNNYSISNYILPIFLQVHSPRGTASHPMPSFLARTTHKFAACPRWNRYPLLMPTYSNETHKFEVNPLALNNSLGILFVFCFP